MKKIITGFAMISAISLVPAALANSHQNGQSGAQKGAQAAKGSQAVKGGQQKGGQFKGGQEKGGQQKGAQKGKQS